MLEGMLVQQHGIYLILKPQAGNDSESAKGETPRGGGGGGAASTGGGGVSVASSSTAGTPHHLRVRIAAYRNDLSLGQYL